MTANTDYLSTPPGAVLRAAREEKSISLNEVADALHLRPAVVEALENGDYEGFDSTVFLKGYFRSYCRLVGLHEERMVELLDAQLVERKQELAEQELEVQKEIAKKKRLKLFKGLSIGSALVLIIALAGFLLLPSDSPEPEPMADGRSVDAQQPASAVVPFAPESSSPQVSEELSDGSVKNESAELVEQSEAVVLAEGANADEDASSTDTEQGQTESASEATEVSQGQSSAAGDSMTPEQTVATTAPPIASVNEGRLLMSFSGDCWVEVQNAEGRKLVAQLKRAGDTLEYSGGLPFTLVLGNGRVANIEFNGAEFDLAPYIRRNGVAEVVFE